MKKSDKLWMLYAKITFLLLFNYHSMAEELCPTSIISPKTQTKLIKDMCEIEQSLQCKEFAAKNPDLKDKMNQCRMKPIVLGLDPLKDFRILYGCGLGLKNLAQDTFQAISDFLTFVVKTAHENSRKNSDFIVYCDHSPSCKKKLAALHPTWKNKTDLELQKASTNEILIQLNAWYDSVQRTKANAVTSKSKINNDHANDPEMDIQTQLENQKHLMDLIKSYLNDLNIKLECYNDIAQTELICYGLASILGLNKIAKIPGWIRKASGFSIDNETMVNAARMQAKVEAGVRSPAVDTDRLRKTVAGIWSDSSLSYSDKAHRTFETYIAQRMEAMTPERQELAKKALADVRHGKSEKAHYNTSNGKITVGDPATDDLINFYSQFAHEFEHLDQVGLSPIKSIKDWGTLIKKVVIENRAKSEMQRLTFEAEAIGAQWDLLHAIPTQYREQAIAKIMSSNISQRAKDVFTQEMEWASLSRGEFIRRSASASGHTMMNPEEILLNQAIRRLFVVGTAATAIGFMPQGN